MNGWLFSCHVSCMLRVWNTSWKLLSNQYQDKWSYSINKKLFFSWYLLQCIWDKYPNWESLLLFNLQYKMESERCFIHYWVKTCINSSHNPIACFHKPMQMHNNHSINWHSLCFSTFVFALVLPEVSFFSFIVIPCIELSMEGPCLTSTVELALSLWE